MPTKDRIDPARIIHSHGLSYELGCALVQLLHAATGKRASRRNAIVSAMTHLKNEEMNLRTEGEF